MASATMCRFWKALKRQKLVLVLVTTWKLQFYRLCTIALSSMLLSRYDQLGIIVQKMCSTMLFEFYQLSWSCIPSFFVFFYRTPLIFNFSSYTNCLSSMLLSRCDRLGLTYKMCVTMLIELYLLSWRCVLSYFIFFFSGIPLIFNFGSYAADV